MSKANRFFSGENLRQLMRHHHVTIATMAGRLGLPESRVCWRLAHGFSRLEAEVLRDWVQAITQVDPGHHSVDWWLDIARNIGSRQWSELATSLAKS